ncbi:MAG: TetR family transcriptional regulator C-terminal domain-containing protein, partial [Bradymonadaceae bacterium]
SVLPRVLQAATSGDDQFKGLIEAVISFFCEDPDRARLLMREMMDRPERMRGLLNEYLSPWMSILSDYIEKGQEEGTVYPDLDPTSYIVNVVHLVVGGIATSGVFGTLIDDESDDAGVSPDQIDEVVRLTGAALFIDGQRAEAAEEADSVADEDQSTS